MEYRIKEILKERNLGISEFAEKIGLQRETLSRIINGASTSTETLQKIAKELDIAIPLLFKQQMNEEDTITCPNCGKRFKMEE